ncbi:MAG: protein kinase [Polyangiales bacterium]
MQAPQPLAQGDLFAGDYRVERELARGGMGTLYLVRQVSTGAARVLKLMHARLTGDARSRDRFIQEARVSARIESDHVVQVLAAGFDDRGVPWLVMEHLRGEDLSTAIERRGRFSPSDALEILRQLCHALGAAHAAGLVHRDLKPENVFLAQARREGAPFTVKLLDFGIAKVLEEAATAPDAPPGRRYQTSALGTPLDVSRAGGRARHRHHRGRRVVPRAFTFAVLTGRSYWKVGDAPTVPLDGLLRELFIDPWSLRRPARRSTASASRRLRRVVLALRLPRPRRAHRHRGEALAPSRPSSATPSAVPGVAPYAPLDPWGSAQGTPSPGVPFGPNLTPPAVAARTPEPVHPAVTPVTVPPPTPLPPNPFASGHDNPLPTTGNRWGGATPAPTPPPVAPPPPASWAPPPPPATVLASYPPANPYASAQRPYSQPPATAATAWGQSTPAPAVLDGRVSIHGAPPPTRPRRGSSAAWVIVGLLLGASAVGGGVVLYLYDQRPDPPRRRAPRRPPPQRAPVVTPPPRYVPPTTPELATLSAGWAHACAVRADTAVACWGWNHFGQLGDGSTIDRASPATAVGLAGAVEVAAGASHTCARLSNGTVACWGANAHGELGDGTTTPRPTPALARHLGGATQVVAGDAFACARLANGTVACWGANDVGQLGDGTDVDKTSPTLVPGLANIVEVAAGDAHACARHASGAVYCWGASSFGQVGDGHLMSHFRPALVAGLRDAASPPRPAAVVRGHPRGRRAVLGPQRPRAARRRHAGGPHHARDAHPLGAVQSLALGGRHACAVDLDRGMRCWGDNGDGQVGDGTASPRPSPTRLPTLSGARRPRSATASAARGSPTAACGAGARTSAGSSAWAGAPTAGSRLPSPCPERLARVQRSREAGLEEASVEGLV